MMDKYTELAKRIYDITDPWEREDMTPNDFAEYIKDEPLDVIKHLLDIIEDLQA